MNTLFEEKGTISLPYILIISVDIFLPGNLVISPYFVCSHHIFLFVCFCFLPMEPCWIYALPIILWG